MPKKTCSFKTQWSNQRFLLCWIFKCWLWFLVYWIEESHKKQIFKQIPEYDKVFQVSVICKNLSGLGLIKINSKFSELDDDEVFYPPPPVTSALSHATSGPKLIFDINVVKATRIGVLDVRIDICSNGLSSLMIYRTIFFFGHFLAIYLTISGAGGGVNYPSTTHQVYQSSTTPQVYQSSTTPQVYYPPPTSANSLHATSVNSVTFFLTQSQEQHEWSN